MKSQYIKRIIYVLVFSIIIALLCIIFETELFKAPVDLLNFHFNIITINSIIAGFSFTAIGILISVADSEVVQKINRTDYMSKKNERLVTSVVLCCSSIFISLLYIIGLEDLFAKLFLNKIKFLSQFTHKFMYISCVLFLLFGIIFFLISIKDVSRILGKVYKNKSTLTKESVNEIDSAFRNKNQ